MRNQKILVVGAGLSGSVVANELAHHNWQVDVIDIRSHLGGTCYTKRDDRTGIMLHMYGPHIIHTNSQFVWEYLGSLAPIQPYINRVKAIAQGKRYSLPINLQTINAFFNRDFTESEAKQFIHSIRKNILHPQNFEEQALSTIGKELYQAFFYGYSKKQWGTDPTNLSASVFKKLPVRFTNNDNYYDVKYQGIPEQGYSVIIETLLRHPAITVHLNTPYLPSMASHYAHVFYSGEIDKYYQYRFGKLGYRTLEFERTDLTGIFQDTAVVNYCDETVPYTRITEFKHLTPWEKHAQSVYFKEYSKAYTDPFTDTPLYPLGTLADKQLFSTYQKMAHATEHQLTFIGRLGTYTYISMDSCILTALHTSQIFLNKVAAHQPIPAFI